MRIAVVLFILLAFTGCQMKPSADAPPKRTSHEVDRILSEMELGNIAFNSPSSMNLHDSATIVLVLSIDTPIEELMRRIEEVGQKNGRENQDL